MARQTKDAPTVVVGKRRADPGRGERLGLTVDEAANLLGISRALAYELVADGSLPCLRLRRRIIVPRAALLRLLDPTAGDGDDPEHAG